MANRRGRSRSPRTGDGNDAAQHESEQRQWPELLYFLNLAMLVHATVRLNTMRMHSVALSTALLSKTPARRFEVDHSMS